MASSDVVRALAKLLARDMRDQDTIKTQFSTEDVSSYFQLFTYGLTASDRGLRIGTGSTGGPYTIVRVIQPNRKYVEHFYSDFYKDTSSTNATWSTSGEAVLN